LIKPDKRAVTMGSVDIAMPAFGVY
jgi:hypothetical protein